MDRDNCKGGPLSQVGPGPPTCLIRPCLEARIVLAVKHYRRFVLFNKHNRTDWWLNAGHRMACMN